MRAVIFLTATSVSEAYQDFRYPYWQFPNYKQTNRHRLQLVRFYCHFFARIEFTPAKTSAGTSTDSEGWAHLLQRPRHELQQLPVSTSELDLSTNKKTLNQHQKGHPNVLNTRAFIDWNGSCSWMVHLSWRVMNCRILIKKLMMIFFGYFLCMQQTIQHGEVIQPQTINKLILSISTDLAIQIDPFQQNCQGLTCQ